MLFFKSVLVAATALASFAAAQSTVIQFTKTPTTVVAGNAYTLQWKTTDETTPITIKLRVGASNDLSDVTVLTSDATGGSYTWTPDKGLGDSAYYALEIIQGNQINYSGQISLTGGSASSLPATASATASAASASASSASASSASASSASASSASASASSASASAASTLSTATITGSSSSATESASKSKSASSGSATAASTKTTGSASTTTNSAMGAPTSTGAAAKMGSSPMALIFGAAAMMAYLN